MPFSKTTRVEVHDANHESLPHPLPPRHARARARPAASTCSKRTTLPNEAVPNCGVQSVINFARYSCETIALAQVEALKQAYPQSEVSLFGVQQIGQDARSGTAKASQLAVADLGARVGPFIAAMPDHFQFVEQLESRLSAHRQITAGLQIVPRADWARDYQGVALVRATQTPYLQNRASSRRTGASSHLARCTKQWKPKSAIRPTKPLQTFRIFRLRVQQHRCLSQWPREVKAGDKFTLSIGIDLPAAGTFSQTVSIPTVAQFWSSNDFRYGDAWKTLSRSIRRCCRSAEIVPAQNTQRHADGARHGRQAAAPVLGAHFFAPSYGQHLGNRARCVCKFLTRFQAPDYKRRSFLRRTGSFRAERSRRHAARPTSANSAARQRGVDQSQFASALDVRLDFSALHAHAARLSPGAFAAFDLEAFDAPNFLRTEVICLDAHHTQWNLKVTLSPSQAATAVIEPLRLQLKTEGHSDVLSVPIAAIIESNAPH